MRGCCGRTDRWAWRSYHACGHRACQPPPTPVCSSSCARCLYYSGGSVALRLLSATLLPTNYLLLLSPSLPFSRHGGTCGHCALHAWLGHGAFIPFPFTGSSCDEACLGPLPSLLLFISVALISLPLPLQPINMCLCCAGAFTPLPAAALLGSFFNSAR